MKLVDRTNQKYGKLTVIARAPDQVLKSGIRKVVWHCKCDCGTELIVQSANLGNGHSKSCGCSVKEACSRNFTTHGLTETRAYRAWCEMKSRCKNPNMDNYYLYGGRGISVCDRWKSSFENFLSDMGHPPSNKHSLDRIDPNGNYEPSNCRWADRYEQANNKRNNRVLTVGDKTMTVSQWAREIGLSSSALWCRLKYWPLEKALTTKRLRNYPKTP